MYHFGNKVIILVMHAYFYNNNYDIYFLSINDGMLSNNHFLHFCSIAYFALSNDIEKVIQKS